MAWLSLPPPWLFGFTDNNETARNLFVDLGATFLVVYFLTDWHAQTQTTDTQRGHTITDKGTHLA